MNDIRKRLGYNICRLRKKKGWSQSKLAEVVEISSTFMMHIEHGTRGASLETIDLLANALDVDVSVLFTKPRELIDADDENDMAKSKFESEILERISEAIKDCIDEHYLV